MQVTLQIDDALLAEAIRLGAPQAPQQLITEALRAYLHQYQRLAALQKTAGPTAWEVLDALAGTVDGPEDWAEEHDHYLYGTPKQKALAGLQEPEQNASAVSPETEGTKMLKILENHGLLGCMEGDGQLSVDYKKHLWGNE